MLVYLTHPQHGTHVAYTHDEVERLTRLYGWKVKEPEAPNPEPEPKATLHLPRKAAR